MDENFGKTQWYGKKVAFLGDSITDANHVGTTKNYWQYLTEMLGIEHLVYGINGNRWCSILEQAQKLKAEHPEDVDAIFIFVGTNDYNGSVPPGVWWNMTSEVVPTSSGPALRSRRILSRDVNTVRGNINVAMEYLRENFPLQQIVMMTPIHRGYATFGPTNIQPEETYCNGLGLFVEDYVQINREAADLWAVPLIDLFRVSSLHPLTKSHGVFFHDSEVDLLHPSAEGHRRIAKAMACQMLAMPADFK